MLLSNILQASNKYKQHNGLRKQHSMRNTITHIHSNTDIHQLDILPELVSPISSINERSKSISPKETIERNNDASTMPEEEYTYLCCNHCRRPHFHIQKPSISIPKLHTNTQQRFIVIGMFIFEFYKIVMGTFLTIFVPQQCDYGVCRIYDNLFRNSIFHIIANAWNTLTFLVVCHLYWIELKRENWAIEYLEIDEGKPYSNLIDEVEDYPFLRDDMYSINKKYLYNVYFTLCIASINFCISAISIYENYAGLNTITSFATFLVLIGIKFNNAYEVASESNEYSALLSAYMKTPRIFNTVDENYKMHDINVRDIDDMSIHERIEMETIPDKQTHISSKSSSTTIENITGIEENE